MDGTFFSIAGSTLLDRALDAVIGIDGESRIVDWNRQAEIIFGWTRAEVLGTSMTERIIPERYREAHTMGMAHYRATGNAAILNERIEITAIRRDGSEFPVELTVTALPGTEAQPGEFYYSFLRDISVRVDQAAALVAARDAAEAAVRARDEFLSIASHELKTPLTSLKLRTQLSMRRWAEQDDVRAAFESCDRQIDRIERLVDDMLDLARIAHGKIFPSES